MKTENICENDSNHKNESDFSSQASALILTEVLYKFMKQNWHNVKFTY